VALFSAPASLRGMSWEDWKNAGAMFQSFVTGVGIIFGGIWAYLRYVRQEENNPYIEFSADLNFVGRQAGWWIVEIVAFVENKGKVQHRMREFTFELDSIYSVDPVALDPRWGNQVNFEHALARGSFRPQSYRSFFIAPTVKASYSHITRVPAEATFLLLHCGFRYPDTLLDRIRNLVPRYRRTRGHVAEKTVRVPDDPINGSQAAATQ
jgi:hypothetical protein